MRIGPFCFTVRDNRFSGHARTNRTHLACWSNSDTFQPLFSQAVRGTGVLGLWGGVVDMREVQPIDHFVDEVPSAPSVVSNSYCLRLHPQLFQHPP